jgi:curved DNA-binding protein
MKYKDYYAILGVPRTATAEEIQKAYRKLARQYHPDISKEPGAEEKFKEVGEAHDTLADAAKRAAYDRLGEQRPGEEVRPPPEWREEYTDSGFNFDDIDLADLFAGLRGGRPFGGRPASGGRPQGMAIPGQDVEVTVPISLEDAYHGTSVNLDLSMLQPDEHGVLRRVPHAFTARIPKGASGGDRLRVPGKGGPGMYGGPHGDLFLNIELQPHALFRVDGHDVYLDLPLAPWEAVLGTSVEVPTPDGAVQLKVPPGTQAGQNLRLAKRGLPRPRGEAGDLLAVARIAVPAKPSERELALYKQLGDESKFNPRAHYAREVKRESRTH